MEIFFLYAHLNEISVSQSDTVKMGQNIGKLGNMGHSFGAHLHFEVRLQWPIRVNPLEDTSNGMVKLIFNNFSDRY